MTDYTTFTVETDEDGIAVMTIDLPGQSMNVWNADLIRDFTAFIDEFASNERLKGLVITSGKESGFLAGADLRMLGGMPADATPQQIFDENFKLQSAIRKMETAGRPAKDLTKGNAVAKPVVCALNGLALGGGMGTATIIERVN